MKKGLLPKIFPEPLDCGRRNTFQAAFCLFVRRFAGGSSMGIFLQDLRYALRMLVKSPGFALMAILTLAIGIGANTAIFTVLNAVLLRPLPFHEPARLMVLNESSPQFDDMSVAYQNYTDWKAQNGSFEDMVMFRRRDLTLTGDRGPEHIDGRQVSAGFFNLLGTRLEMGRDFRPEDDHEGSAPVAVISHGLWQRRFGGDHDILGKTIHLNDLRCDTNRALARPSLRRQFVYDWIQAVKSILQ